MFCILEESERRGDFFNTISPDQPFTFRAGAALAFPLPAVRCGAEGQRNASFTMRTKQPSIGWLDAAVSGRERTHTAIPGKGPLWSAVFRIRMQEN
ncbi:hypothetical protein DDZ14_16860 [Maritimibacter sp. 55A14]|nr:hypothetical protein DDZ14_16860 [Maritimibacter sp. 55A14]